MSGSSAIIKNKKEELLKNLNISLLIEKDSLERKIDDVLTRQECNYEPCNNIDNIREEIIPYIQSL